MTYQNSDSSKEIGISFLKDEKRSIYWFNLNLVYYKSFVKPN